MRRLLAALLALSACGPNAGDKLATLPVREETRAALGRLRWQQLHDNDKLHPGDVVLCGTRDRALIGFSKSLVVEFLGRDSDWLLPELFTAEKKEEVLLAVPPKQLMRLELPRGIGSDAKHPDGWVREVAGYPLVTSDLRAIGALFSGDEVQELFALRDDEAPESADETPPPADPSKPPNEWRLGVRVYPRMGPRTGVVVSGVLPDTPAESAGLKKGDRIVKMAGQPVTSFRELQRALSNVTEPVVTLEVRKKASKTNMQVTIDLSQ
jgi:hypothetical protein